MKAGVWVVSSCLDMAVKIKVVFPYREVPRQQPGLWRRQWNYKTDVNIVCYFILEVFTWHQWWAFFFFFLRFKPDSLRIPAIFASPWASLLSLQVSVSCSSPPAVVSPVPPFSCAPPPEPAGASPSHAPAQVWVLWVYVRVHYIHRQTNTSVYTVKAQAQHALFWSLKLHWTSQRHTFFWNCYDFLLVFFAYFPDLMCVWCVTLAWTDCQPLCAEIGCLPLDACFQ